MEENKLNINLSPEIAEGTYANLAIIAHSPSEFVFDFVRVMPGLKQANVKSRVVMTPDQAKKLLMDRNAMTEPEAFRYIQKTSMDTGRSLVESAQMVLTLLRE